MYILTLASPAEHRPPQLLLDKVAGASHINRPPELCGLSRCSSETHYERTPVRDGSRCWVAAFASHAETPWAPDHGLQIRIRDMRCGEVRSLC